MWREQQLLSPAAKLIVHGAFIEGDLDIPNLERRVYEWYFDTRSPRAAKLESYDVASRIRHDCRTG
jgi:hypothetical protein